MMVLCYRNEKQNESMKWCYEIKINPKSPFIFPYCVLNTLKILKIMCAHKSHDTATLHQIQKWIKVYFSKGRKVTQWCPSVGMKNKIFGTVFGSKAIKFECLLG